MEAASPMQTSQEDGATFDIGLEVEIETEPMDTDDDNDIEEDLEAGDENVEDLPNSQPTEEDMNKLVLEASSANTHKATQWGLRKFNDWNTKRNRNIDLTTISQGNLNVELRRFYAEVKGNRGQPLTPSGLTGIRAAIHRHLTQPPLSRNINILTDTDFTTANQMFTARCRLYYKSGNKRPQHKPAIGQGDMEKLKDYFSNWDNNPNTLIEYTWFSLCFFFGRRGREGWRDMTKKTFSISKDDKNRKYISMAETDLTKNNRGGNKQSEQDYSKQQVYGSPGHLNFIQVFEFYLSKLNPNCSALFQTPLNNYQQDKHWFRNEAMGKNTLSSIMKRISQKAGLSTEYTCHSVRASTITTLSQAGVEGRQICQVTKHRNEASLKHYVEDMSNEQKKKCSSILSQALTNEKEQPQSYTMQCQDDDQGPSPPGEGENSVVAAQLPDGSFAIIIPTNPKPQAMCQQTTVPVHYNTVETTSTATDLKYLQNMLPHCKFEGCTININTKEP